MLVIPGDQGKVTCDGLTRRELLRVGGSALMGLSLAQTLQLESLAAAEGHRPVVELLLSRGADAEATDEDGDAAVDHARERGRKEIVTLLESRQRE